MRSRMHDGIIRYFSRVRDLRRHLPGVVRDGEVERAVVPLDEGALALAAFICCTHRDYPYKREYGRENDRRPSSSGTAARRAGLPEPAIHRENCGP